jgi:hypothetical protein
MVKNFTNEKTFKALMREGRPLRETIKYMLDCEAIGIGGVAKHARLSDAAVSMTISGKKPNLRAQEAVCDLLEFNPWEEFAKFQKHKK